MVDEQQQSSRSAADTTAYVNASIIKTRLETDTLLSTIKSQLMGETVIIEPDPTSPTGYKETISKSKEPLMNETGVLSILSYLRMIINQAGVQGNFSEEQYEQFMYYHRGVLLDTIVSNAPKWGLSSINMRIVYHSICGILEMFVSRLINNKERESYAQTLRSSESVSTSQHNRWF